ncbi:pantetheine-phosphate adenylyltransferase [Devosia sp. ZB163]|uniref:pantetheine-phosphate adenylyltransferase n=1 Tax=Devosia sp. ZB163 TaxID=3025938 RepID=UPI00235F7AAF|nr:pantetheine-phosphate adenylyltransferase [Devosia sp. ZB163]MDC9826041.1 pantetheine-phosphate adenylyltransferase [Devosia sp. ZB163]
MARLVGFYPGSFDPLTNGHLDVIERACKIVDELVIAVGTHHSKNPLFSHIDRVALLKAVLEPVGRRTDTDFRVVDFDGLAVNAARENGARLIIRGLRDTTDYNYEMQMVGMNAQMAPDLQTVFLPSSPPVRHISATLVRQIAQLGGDISKFVPPQVIEALKKTK